MKKVLGTIGLCRRAGKLIFGFDSVIDEIKKPKSKVSGVIIADDLSEKTKKEVRFACDNYGVSVFAPGIIMEELKQVIGKHSGILAVLDDGLFQAIINSYNSSKLGDIE